MSRRLVSRTQRTAESQETPSAPRTASTLPPYQAPACALTDKGKRELEAIPQNHDYRKLSEHLKRAIEQITGTAADASDRYESRKRAAEKRAQRQAQADSPHEKTEAEEQNEEHLAYMATKVEELTADSEKAMRDLIDLQEELAQQTIALREINENIAATPAPAQRNRRRPAAADSDDEDWSEEEPVEVGEIPASILSPTEMMRSAQQQHTASWNAKSMRARYAENNDYKGFKGVIHSSKHPGENAPPVPHARTWFPEDASRPGRKSQGHLDEDDDDIVIEGLTLSLKCPLTLQMLNEPYSNKKCPHVFEKDAILEYHNQNAVAFQDGRRGRGQRAPRQLQCPQTGCHAMLELDDFYVDALMVRQVKRAREQETMGESDDEVDDDSRLPPGSQRRPEEIDDDEVQRRQSSVKIKERASMARTSTAVDEDSDIEMGSDD